MERKRWYKDKVFYQIWPRSFKDGDGDGMGDLWGVYEKLDYIKSLGCDGIWFSPIYPSPGADCGYDISNYRDIAPEFGGIPKGAGGRPCPGHEGRHGSCGEPHQRRA